LHTYDVIFCTIIPSKTDEAVFQDFIYTAKALLTVKQDDEIFSM